MYFMYYSARTFTPPPPTLPSRSLHLVITQVIICWFRDVVQRPCLWPAFRTSRYVNTVLLAIHNDDSIGMKCHTLMKSVRDLELEHKLAQFVAANAGNACYWRHQWLTAFLNRFDPAVYSGPHKPYELVDAILKYCYIASTLSIWLLYYY